MQSLLVQTEHVRAEQKFGPLYNECRFFIVLHLFGQKKTFVWKMEAKNSYIAEKLNKISNYWLWLIS